MAGTDGFARPKLSHAGRERYPRIESMSPRQRQASTSSGGNHNASLDERLVLLAVRVHADAACRHFMKIIVAGCCTWHVRAKIECGRARHRVMTPVATITFVIWCIQPLCLGSAASRWRGITSRSRMIILLLPRARCARLCRKLVVTSSASDVVRHCDAFIVKPADVPRQA